MRPSIHARIKNRGAGDIAPNDIEEITRLILRLRASVDLIMRDFARRQSCHAGWTQRPEMSLAERG